MSALDEMLKSVNYATLEKYQPGNFSLALLNFAKLVNEDSPEVHNTPIVHLMAWDTIPGEIQHILWLCFRGWAKSTSLEYLNLYLGATGFIPDFGEVTGSLYIGDTMLNGCKTFRKNLEHKYNNSKFLKNHFKVAHFTDSEINFETSQNAYTIRLFGADSGVRGVRMQGDRPQIAFCDDLLTNESAKSPTIIRSIKDTIYKSVEYALDPNRSKIIFCGTPFQKNDPIVEAAESGAWKVSLFPVCQKFPVDKKDFVSAWPDRFNYEAVNRKYITAKLQGEAASFQQEMMLRLGADDQRMVLNNDIQWYSRRVLMDKRDYYNFYITTDFAMTAKQSADYSCIDTWAYSSNGDFFLVDGFLGKVTPDIWMEALFSLVQKYNPLGVGVEVSGQQRAIIHWIQQKQLETGMFFNLAHMKGKTEPGIFPATDKVSRFKLVQPLFKAHKMYFPKEAKEAIAIGKDSGVMSPEALWLSEHLEELSLATEEGFKGHDDCLDCVSQLGYIQPHKPDGMVSTALDLNDEGNLITKNLNQSRETPFVTRRDIEGITKPHRAYGSYLV